MKVKKSEFNQSSDKQNNASETLYDYQAGNIRSGNFLKNVSIKCQIEEIFVQTEIKIDLANNTQENALIFLAYPISIHSSITDAEVIHSGKKHQLEYFTEYQKSDNKKNTNVYLSKLEDGIIQIVIDKMDTNEDISIIIHITETLKQKAGCYEFLLPNTINPRISNNEGDKNLLIDYPYYSGDKDLFTSEFEIQIKSKFNIENIYLPTHNANIKYTDNNNVLINNSKNDECPCNRDIYLRFEYQKGTDTILYKNQDHFLIEYKTNIEEDQGFIPREYFFLLDISENTPINSLDLQFEMLIAILYELQPIDKFNIIVFSSEFSIFSKRSLFATFETIEQAIDFVKKVKPKGIADIEKAFKHCNDIELPYGYFRNYILLSNGFFTLNNNSVKNIRKYILQNRLYILCIGNSPNRNFADEMTSQLPGEYFILPSNVGGWDFVDTLFEYIKSSQISDITIDLDKDNISETIPYTNGSLLLADTIYISGISKESKFQKLGIIVSANDKICKSREFYVIDIENKYALAYYFAKEKVKYLDSGIKNYNEIKQIKKLSKKFKFLNNDSYLARSSVSLFDLRYQDMIFQEMQIPAYIDDGLKDKKTDYKVGMDKIFFFRREYSDKKNPRVRQKQKLIFDDTVQYHDDLNIYIEMPKKYIKFAVFSNDKDLALSRKLSDSSSIINQKINQLTGNGLPTEGIIYFEMIRNKDDESFNIENFTANLNQIEYKESAFLEFKSILIEYFQDYFLNSDIKRDWIVCLIEYKHK